MIFIKKLTLLVIFLLPVYISSFKEETTFFKPIIVHLIDKDLYLDLDDYVVGVVASEMPALFEEEALKAQAVASRSYAMNRCKDNIIEISSSINDQVYSTNYELYSKWNEKYDEYYQKINNAVDMTKNKVVSRDGKILKTYYFSMSNGYTEDSQTVFKETLFTSVESPLEKNLGNFIKKKDFSKDELLSLLNVTNISIGKIILNETNHVDKIFINDKEYSGIEIRKLLKLRSTDFEIKEKGDIFTFITKGYGHGVGMSQYGANEMAKQGKKYEEILMYYYQNTEITNLYV